MGVPGPKLLDDEKSTQDLLCVSTPTFVTPDTRANAELQHWSLQERAAVLLRQLQAADAHPRLDHAAALDEDPDAARSRATTSAACPTCSAKGRRCSTRSATRLTKRTRVPRLPLRPPDNYLRDAMVATLARAGRRVRHPAPAADRSVPDADREQRRPVADEALAARAGRRAADPQADVRLARAARLRAGALATTRGTASRSTARSATRAGRGSGCTASCRGCGSS